MVVLSGDMFANELTFAAQNHTKCKSRLSYVWWTEGCHREMNFLLITRTSAVQDCSSFSCSQIYILSM